LNKTKNKETELDDVFFINNIKVDTRRGEIHHQQVLHSVEPKVMSVLLYLCQNLGEVISPEILFEKVWPKSIYSPSSVRRCIALLRTALNDENKAIIITHPKRGYSLKAILTNDHRSKNSFNISVVAQVQLAALSLFLLAAAITYLNGGFNSTVIEAKSAVTIININPLTATKEYERFSRYSPDGKFLAFIRSSENSIKSYHIWLKNVDTLQEHKLNSVPANYIYLAWSSVVDDQQTLVAAVKKPSGISFEQIQLNNNFTYKSHSTEFVKKEAQWISPFFIDHNKVIYFLAFEENKSSLYSYHLGTTKQTQLLEQTAEFKPYKIALSRDKKSLAILGFNQQHLSQIKLFSFIDHSTSLLTTLDSNWYFVDWFPDNQSLLLSDGKGLQQLTLLKDSATSKLVANELYSLDFNNFDFLRYPHVSPSGKSIAFNRESYDQDIWLTPVQAHMKKLLLVDSNTADWGAKLSPDSSQFAFISMRNGHSQLFVYDFTTKRVRLVYENKKQDLAIAPPIWSTDGLKLISAANDHVFIVQLTQLNEGSEMPTVKTLPDVIGVPMQSYYQEDAILMLSKRDKENSWVKVDLSTLASTHLLWVGNKKALLNHNDQLIIIRGGQVLDVEQKLLTKVDGYIKQFFAKADHLYLLVAEKEKKHLVKILLNDLNNQQLLSIKGFKNEQLWDVSNEGMVLSGSELINKDLIELSIK